MKKISNITLAAIGLGFITSLVSCSDPMEEIKDLTLARNFAPVALTAKVINKTNVKLEWNKSDAQYYVIEVFANDSLTFAGSAEKTISDITDNTYTVTGLEGETKYSFRVKAVTKDNASRDSKWSTAFAETDAEQILKEVDLENDVTANAVTLRWPAGQKATQIVATPGDITHEVTAAEIAAGAATVTGLQPETAYTFKLMNGTKTRGTAKATTAIDLGGATLVKAGEDLAAAIAAAEDGAALALMPGTYAILNDEGKVATTAISKSISIKSVRAYDRAIIKTGFVVTNGASLTLTQIVLDGDKTAAFAVDYSTAEAGAMGNLTFEGCDLTGFTKGLIYQDKTAIKMETMTINNCVLRDISAGQDLIDFRKGAYANFFFTNSTVYNVNCRDFIRFDDSASSFEGLTPFIKIDHCTLNGLGSTNKGILYTRFGGNTGHSIIFSNNIVSNSPGIFSTQSKTASPAFSGNNYFNSPNLVEATADAGLKSIIFDNAGTAYDPQYADAENGDFTVGSDDVKALKIGDPRWIK